jgi:hypothetical protein
MARPGCCTRTFNLGPAEYYKIRNFNRLSFVGIGRALFAGRLWRLTATAQLASLPAFCAKYSPIAALSTIIAKCGAKSPAVALAAYRLHL